MRNNFIKEEKRQQLFYKAASAIKGLDDNGGPIYGTKIKKVLDDGSIKEDWRYTPKEAELLWSKLTDREKGILIEYIKPIEKAQTLFSRELLKQRAKIERGVEGYIHKYYEDKIGDRFRKIFFKFRKAAPTKRRAKYIDPETGRVTELTGNVENFEKAVSKQIENVVNAQEYNKFIQIWQDLLTEPLNEENPLKKGWVEVRGTLKTGIPTDKPKIFKTEEGYGVAPQVRRQTPGEIKDNYMRPLEDAMEASVMSNAIKSIGRYWKGNVLLYPGTASTNFISGGLQYLAKLSEDFYKHGVFGGNFKPFLFDIIAPIKAFTPSAINRIKPEFIGAKVNIATQFGKPVNIIDKFIQVGLTPFGMVETYWKRVISIAQLDITGGKAENLLKDYELFKKVGKENDIYGFNYSNIPLLLNNFRASTLGAWIYPFPVYGYKYGRMMGRYTFGAVSEIFKGNRKEGFARLATLASIMALIYLFAHKDDDDKVGEYVSEMKYPGEFDITGRIKVSGTDKKEGFLRVIKYPFLNFFKLLQSGSDILTGHKEKGYEQIKGLFQEYVSEGPGLQLLFNLLGYRDKFSQYKSDGQLYGETIKSFIPVFRMNEAISILIDPRKVKEETFRQAIERAIFFTPSGEQREGFMDKKLEYDRESKMLELLLGLNIREIDIDEYNEARDQVIQNMVYRIEEDKDISPQSKERAKEVLKLFNIKEDEYGTRLRDRKRRMEKVRKKDR